MKINLISSASTAALMGIAIASSGAAFAQSTDISNPSTLGGLVSSVTISGVADAYVGSRQLAGGAKVNKVDSSGMSTSQINIAGDKKFANGLKAEFALGMFYRIDDGGQGRFAGDTYFGRNAYVGVGNGYGTLRFGRQSTGNFTAMLRTNSFADSSAFGPVFLHNFVSAIAQGPQFLSPGAPPTSRSLTGVMGTTDSAWNNSLVYISPKIGDVTVQAQWAPSEAAAVGSRYGVSAVYANGPAIATLTSEQMGTGSVPASGPAAAAISKQSTWQLSGAYAFGFGRVSAGYFNTKRNYAAVANDTVTTFQVGAAIPVSAISNVLVQVAQSKQTPQLGVAVSRNTTSLGYTHTVLKDVDAYAVFMRDRLSNQSGGTTIGLGLRYRF